MGEHTKGPWKHVGFGDVRGPDDVCICLTHTGPEMAEADGELIARAPEMEDLIAIYERDRTKHLRLIEGADTDLAELGESLGEEIERLTDQVMDRDRLLLEMQIERNKVKAQRDEVVEAVTNLENDADTIPANLWEQLQTAIEKATP